MLGLSCGQVESLCDEVLPGEARELPGDLAALDVLLRDAQLLAPVASRGRASNAFTLALGDLRQEVPHAVEGAVLAV